MGIVTAVLILEKFVYATILFIWIFLPREKLSVKRKTVLFGSMFLALTVTVIWMRVQGGMLAITNTEDMLITVVSKPLTVFMALLFNISYAVPLSLMQETPRAVIILIVALISWILFLPSRGWKKSQKIQIFIARNRYTFLAFGVFLLSMGMTLGLLFVTWNSSSDVSGMMIISGWQDRYLYPVLPLLIFAYQTDDGKKITDK